MDAASAVGQIAAGHVSPPPALPPSSPGPDLTMWPLLGADTSARKSPGPLTSRTFLPLPGHECPSRSSGPARATCQGPATSASDVAPPPPKKLIRPQTSRLSASRSEKQVAAAAHSAATNTDALLACSAVRAPRLPAIEIRGGFGEARAPGGDERPRRRRRGRGGGDGGGRRPRLRAGGGRGE